METTPNQRHQPMKPLNALRALRELLVNPDDTPRVFEIVRALGRSALHRGVRRFRTTEVGRRVLAERLDLIDTLRDRESLAAIAPGTLGRAYYDFIYGESLSADGLVDASMESGVAAYDFNDPDMKRFGERLRDQHDLWHTVTQYGRNPFGELCLLAFTYAQTRNRGVALIVAGGSIKAIRNLGWRAIPAVWHAYRAGTHASWLPGEDWAALLHLPVPEVRRQLAIAPPANYFQVLEGERARLAARV